MPEGQQFTPEQQAARVDPANQTQSAYPSGTDLGAIKQQVTSEGAQSPTFNARPGERNLELEQANREKMLATGELTAGTNEQLAMEKVNLFTYGVGNPTFGATVSSDPAREEFADQTSKLQEDMKTTQAQLGLSNEFAPIETPEYRLYEDYTEQYEDLQKRSKDIYEQTVENIKLDFEVREKEQRDANRKLSGFQSKNLARFNAYGRSASSLSFMQSVDLENQKAMNQLMALKGQTLIAAAEAAQKRDLELLGDLVSHSQTLTDQFNKVQKQRFDDQIMKADQIMKQNRFGWETEDRAMGKMQNFFEIGVDPTDENAKEDIRQLEQDAGLPEGSYDRLWQISQKEAAQQAVEDALQADLDFAKDLADILKDIPEGRSVQIGDQVYQGFKKGDVWKGTTTDSRGNVTGLTYDETTGVWQSVNLGNIGPSKDGWKLVDADGVKWRVNTQTGETEPVVNKGGAINPGGYDGFNEWASSMGDVTVPYGGSTRYENFHPGYDIAPPGAKSGQYAVNAFLPDGETGVVIGVHDIDDNAYGKYIEIQDSQGRTYKYSHMHSIDVAEGDSINPNTYIGQMGNTGSAYSLSGGDGTHLDFRVYEPGQQLPSNKKEESLSDEELRFQKDYQKQIDLIQKGSKTVEQTRAYLKSAWGMTDAQVDSALEGITEPGKGESEQFLSRDFFSQTLPQEALEQAAADAGFGDLGEGLFNLKDVDTDAYLDYLESLVDAYRGAGYSDEEILKLMQ
jgi:murein DD-endopeptidase MepM/ murein hydrolase activator NlpD